MISNNRNTIELQEGSGKKKHKGGKINYGPYLSVDNNITSSSRLGAPSRVSCSQLNKPIRNTSFKLGLHIGNGKKKSKKNTNRKLRSKK